MNTALSLYPAIDCCVSTTTRDPQDRETRKVSICVEPPIVTIPYPLFILKMRCALPPRHRRHQLHSNSTVYSALVVRCVMWWKP